MIFIQDVELTPNPQALKFILNKEISNNGARHYSNKEEAAKDPFAAGIFKIAGVKSLFYTKRFITIEKHPDVNWGEIQKPLVQYVKNFNENLISEFNGEPAENIEISPTLRKIEEVIDTHIRPALESDGGGLKIVDFKDNILTIKYQGACGSCPAAIYGTLSVIENLLKKEVSPKIGVKASL